MARVRFCKESVRQMRPVQSALERFAMGFHIVNYVRRDEDMPQKL